MRNLSLMELEVMMESLSYRSAHLWAEYKVTTELSRKSMIRLELNTINSSLNKITTYLSELNTLLEV